MKEGYIGVTHHKRVICVVLSIVLFTSGQLLFAGSQNLDLEAIGSGVTRIEYRIGDGAWHEFDTDTLQILLPSLDSNTTLVFRLYQEPEASSPEIEEPVAAATPVEPVTAVEPIAVAEVAEPEVASEVVEPIAAPAVPALMTFDLKAVPSDVSRIEYRLGDDSWKDMDRESLQIELPTPADDTALQLNLYGKKKKPVATYNYRYVEAVGNFINDDPAAIAAARASVAETVAPEATAESVEAASTADEVLMLTDFRIFDLNAIDQEVTRIEYRFAGDDSWSDVDMDTLLIPLPEPETETNLLLRVYVKNTKTTTVSL